MLTRIMSSMFIVDSSRRATGVCLTLPRPVGRRSWLRRFRFGNDDRVELGDGEREGLVDREHAARALELVEGSLSEHRREQQLVLAHRARTRVVQVMKYRSPVDRRRGLMAA